MLMLRRNYLKHLYAFQCHSTLDNARNFGNTNTHHKARIIPHVITSPESWPSRLDCIVRKTEVSGLITIGIEGGRLSKLFEIWFEASNTGVRKRALICILGPS